MLSQTRKSSTLAARIWHRTKKLLASILQFATWLTVTLIALPLIPHGESQSWTVLARYLLIAIVVILFFGSRTVLRTRRKEREEDTRPRYTIEPGPSPRIHDLGVIFVHGIGVQSPGQLISEWGQPLRSAVNDQASLLGVRKPDLLLAEYSWDS